MLTGPAVRMHAKFVLVADMLVLHIVEHHTCLLWPRESVRRATLEMRLARTLTVPGTISAVPVTALDVSMASIAPATVCATESNDSKEER
jgi:hypothetical protein